MPLVIWSIAHKACTTMRILGFAEKFELSRNFAWSFKPWLSANTKPGELKFSRLFSQSLELSCWKFSLNRLRTGKVIQFFQWKHKKNTQRSSIAALAEHMKDPFYVFQACWWLQQWPSISTCWPPGRAWTFCFSKVLALEPPRDSEKWARESIFGSAIPQTGIFAVKRAKFGTERRTQRIWQRQRRVILRWKAQKKGLSARYHLIAFVLAMVAEFWALFRR